jgi:hypothetical protein
VEGHGKRELPHTLWQLQFGGPMAYDSDLWATNVQLGGESEIQSTLLSSPTRRAPIIRLGQRLATFWTLQGTPRQTQAYLYLRSHCTIPIDVIILVLACNLSIPSQLAYVNYPLQVVVHLDYEMKLSKLW